MKYTIFGFYEDNGQRAGFSVEADDPNRAEAIACAKAEREFQAVAVLEGEHTSVEDTGEVCGAKSWREVYPDLFCPECGIGLVNGKCVECFEV